MRRIFNMAAMAATILFGLVGFLAPGYTLQVLSLATVDGSTMGMSEIRAANGALFVGLGLAGLLVKSPVALQVVGAAYAGAAAGRLAGIVIDGAGMQAVWFFAVEAAFAAWLILGNRSAQP
ncbi:DUF4345 family protein [Mangrovicoccus sp. HB161399]|uniref:DUF4345 family protein n=1 Tax=Mangrovicoccus sp. HB161399 TaxID=2720392 RepID=UPI00155420A9|nr:DUF4345 family protein [Mangrovicoccus sp. HB161399]